MEGRELGNDPLKLPVTGTVEFAKPGTPEGRGLELFPRIRVSETTVLSTAVSRAETPRGKYVSLSLV